MVDLVDIKKAIHEKGAKNLVQVSRYTAAGTGCGRCIPNVEKIIAEELKLLSVK